jgi:hypothetical protein
MYIYDAPSLSLRYETGPEEPVTKSRRLLPAKANRTEMISKLWILIFMSMFMVTDTLIHSVLTCSAHIVVGL